jgi:hypothetical protein
LDALPHWQAEALADEQMQALRHEQTKYSCDMSERERCGVGK